ncbi:phytanoyl-CoA hydroxylase-interacting protein-like [Haliotis cracherodii]|uniref:phytanoyl-CoA hydroxylase-interacting protein-like n=1 Tax=Haliotis cracherodii TaxID=6455 RepID=UPI0039EB426D
MAPQIKDNEGDPYCPINRELEGVFFWVTRSRGDLPTISPFGDIRVVVPLERVFDESARLYFLDFYCMSGQSRNHYVTLVLTERKSKANRFCRKHLVRLEEDENVFLMKEGGTYKTLRQDKVWVEVF